MDPHFVSDKIIVGFRHPLGVRTTICPGLEFSSNGWGLLGQHLESFISGHFVRNKGEGVYKDAINLNTFATCRHGKRWLWSGTTLTV